MEKDEVETMLVMKTYCPVGPGEDAAEEKDAEKWTRSSASETQ